MKWIYPNITRGLNETVMIKPEVCIATSSTGIQILKTSVCETIMPPSQLPSL